VGQLTPPPPSAAVGEAQNCRKEIFSDFKGEVYKVRRMSQK